MIDVKIEKSWNSISNRVSKYIRHVRKYTNNHIKDMERKKVAIVIERSDKYDFQTKEAEDVRRFHRAAAKFNRRKKMK